MFAASDSLMHLFDYMFLILIDLVDINLWDSQSFKQKMCFSKNPLLIINHLLVFLAFLIGCK